jgi:vancomycin resistance protein YoaR
VSTDLTPPSEPAPGPRRTVAVVGGFVLGALLLYGLLVVVSGNGVPRGTSVLGVDIGGQSQTAATATLDQALSDTAGRPIKVSVDGEASSVTPAAAGLAFDPAATVSAAAAATYNPITLLARLVTSDELEPVVTVDDAALAAYLADVGAKVDTPATDGSITFTETSAEAVEPADGSILDRAAAGAALRAAYLHPTDAAVVLPMVVASPTVGADAVQEALQTFATPAMAAPVELTVTGLPTGSRTITLKPRDFGPALVMAPAPDGSLAASVNVKKLRAVVDAKLGNGLKEPKNASFRIKNGKPVVVAGVRGQTVNGDELSSGMLAALPLTAGRTATAGVETIEPRLTTTAAKALGVKQVLATFTQAFPYAAYRVTNIGRAARYIDGTLLLPGDTFSMNGTVKERTVANGYTIGTVISGGRFAEELGGGVSTMTTTMWHTAFYAGMQRVEQRGHSFYISRYLPGLEATVAWGSLDLKFRNDSPDGVLIKASITNSSVTVTMYGTKRYKVTAEFGPRTNIRPFKTVYDPAPTCVVQPGVQGFKIVVTRVFHDLHGKVVKREPLTTSYNVADDIHCGSKPKPKPKPSPSTSG